MALPCSTPVSTRTPSRKPQRDQRSGRRQEAARRVLGIDARLDRVALQSGTSLRERQPLARGHPELPFDQIEAGDRLGDRMLDLEPRVHFHEPVAARMQPLRAVGDELDRARAGIADRLRGFHRGLAHRRAQLRAHAGRRRLLDHLLVAALQRAVALVEMDGVAVAVGEHLHLDVARRGDVFLDQHARVAERAVRLRAARLRARPRNRHAGRRGACPCRRRRPPP